MTTIKDSLHVFGDLDAQHLISRAPFQIQRGAHLLSGYGVPPAALGVSGDAYWRVDGGGAGATHLYFNNAGTWLGIA